MTSGRSRDGYVFLITILILGAISSAIVAVLLLFATTMAQSARSLETSHRALSYVHTCAERALNALRTTPGYAGDETVNLSEGSCEILPVGGEGNDARTLCVEGVAGSSTRRMEIRITTLLPWVTIDGWQEVSAFTLCP